MGSTGTRGVALTRREAIACGSLALAAASPLTALAARSLRPHHCAVGAYVNPGNRLLTFELSRRAVARFESLIGQRVALVSTFVAWDEQFPNAGHVLQRDAGRGPLINWEGYADLEAVRAGAFDSLLLERARQCRAFGSRIYLRWAAEFNGEWNPCYGRPREFAAAWRHMVGVFRRAGAANVRWVWCPFAVPDPGPAGDWSRYYPGDAYVDWVGMDGYNWGTARPWSRWQSFADIFGPLFADYRARKPVMICEVACAERGGDKAAWIRRMGEQLAGRFSRVKALVWFNARKETDWRVDSSAASLAAFRSVVAGSRYA